METLLAYVVAYLAPILLFLAALAGVVLARALYEHGRVVLQQRRVNRRAARRRGFVQ